MDKVAAESLQDQRTPPSVTPAQPDRTVQLENYLADQRSALLRKRSPQGCNLPSFFRRRFKRVISSPLNSRALISRPIEQIFVSRENSVSNRSSVDLSTRRITLTNR